MFLISSYSGDMAKSAIMVLANSARARLAPEPFATFKNTKRTARTRITDAQNTMEKSEKTLNEKTLNAENAENEKSEKAKKAKKPNAVKVALLKAIADEKARENMGEYFYYIGKSGNTLNLRASAIEKLAFLYDIEKKNLPNAINENKSPMLYGAIERAIKANSAQFYRTKDKTYKD